MFFVLVSEGSNLTPAHHYGDFRFKTYAPIAFRYFREMFGIRPDDYMVHLFKQRLFYWGKVSLKKGKGAQKHKKNRVIEKL